MDLESQAEKPPPSEKAKWYEVLTSRILNVVIGNSRPTVCHAKVCLFGSLNDTPVNLRLDPRSSQSLCG